MSVESLPARPSSTRNPEAVALGVLFAFVVAASVWAAVVASAYAALDASALPTWLAGPYGLGSFVHFVVGFGVAGLAYVRFRDIEVPIRPPDREALPATAGAVLVPIALVATVALVANAAFDTTLSAVVQRHYSADTSIAFAARSVIAPALFAAVGYGALYYAAVQGRLREVVGPGHAVALTTVVAGFFRVVPLNVPSLLHPELADVPAFVVMVSISVAFGLGVGLAYRATVGDFDAVVGVWQVPVLVAAVLTLFAIVLGFVEVPQGVVDALWVATFGVAAVAYERTRSVWVPMAAVGALELAVGLAVYAEAALGVATLPV